MTDTIIVVRMGAEEHRVALQDGSSISQLKQQLQLTTGLLARCQKLIFKGKVLEDHATLADYKLVSGSKVMLMAAQGAGPRPNSAAAPKLKTPVANASHGLAEKMETMSNVKLAKKRSPDGMVERRAAWCKTGIIALRDLQLTAVDPGWLEGMSTATAADLTYNRLSCLPVTICQLTRLTSLKLSHNCLQDTGIPWLELCSALSCSLNVLQLGNNQLQQLPTCLGQLTALKHLELAANRLQQIATGVLERLVQLEELQLQDNQLQQLPCDLGDCSSLIALNASHNALTELPDSMTRLTKLQILAVDCNKITRLPPQLLSCCSSLCTLCAHNNPITVEDLRAAEGYAEYEQRRQARADKQLGGRVMADTNRAFSEGADVEQWQRWAAGPSGLGSDGSGRAGKS